jgi:hypothetical protein
LADPGHIESLEGQLISKKDFTTNRVTESYAVALPPDNKDASCYIISGLEPVTHELLTVKRKFSHFVLMSELVKGRFKGLYIPLLPSVSKKPTEDTAD